MALFAANHRLVSVNGSVRCDILVNAPVQYCGSVIQSVLLWGLVWMSIAHICQCRQFFGWYFVCADLSKDS